MNTFEYLSFDIWIAAKSSVLSHDFLSSLQYREHKMQWTRFKFSV